MFTSCLTLSLAMHVGSYHAGPGFNNSNPGFALECSRGDYSLTAGAYRNSLWKTSVYAAAGKDLVVVGRVKFGAFAGVATGYGWVLAPIGGLHVAASFQDTNYRLLFLPPVSDKASAAVHLMFSRRF